MYPYFIKEDMGSERESQRSHSQMQSNGFVIKMTLNDNNS